MTVSKLSTFLSISVIFRTVSESFILPFLSAVFVPMPEFLTLLSMFAIFVAGPKSSAYIF